MRVLLDECLPRELAGMLPGHEVRTVPQMGWAGRKNGELYEVARGRFDVLITVDQLLVEQSGLPIGMAVITLVARSNRIDSLRPLVPELLEALARIEPGEHVVVG